MVGMKYWGLGQQFDQQFQSAITQITSQQVQQVAQTYFQCPYVSLVGARGGDRSRLKV